MSGLKIGDKAPDFDLKGTDGLRYSLEKFSAELLVVFFTCNHCPYAQAYEERTKDLQVEFRGKVRFVAINSNDEKKYPEDSYQKMINRARVRNFNFPYLHDETQKVAEKYGALCTPHYFLFDEDRLLVYEGRMDDNWKDPKKVTRNDLKKAIKEVLAGETVSVPKTNPLGCSIKWK